MFLFENQLSGPIPPKLGQLLVIEKLVLNDNRLSGSIPAELGNPSGLSLLELRNNDLTGCIPQVLKPYLLTIRSQRDGVILVLCTIGVTVSASRLLVPEADSATYTVVLNTPPTGSVTIAVAKTPGGDDDITADPATLTFTTASWNTAQTVTIRAADDDDAAHGEATFTHSASGGGYDGVTIASVVVTEGENDTAGVTFSRNTLTVPEGGTAIYTVEMDTRPLATVTMTLTRTGDNDLTVHPTTLTFTIGNWNTPQTITVTAAEDTDADDGQATITHRATGDAAYAAIKFPPVTVIEEDNEKSNAAPTFSSPDVFSVAENTTAAGRVTATDTDASDSITGYTVTGGADQSQFSIDATTGALAFTTAPNFEAPADADTDNAYLVEVTATSGASGRELTATQAITVTVTDAAEAPEAPALPTISSVTASGFTVTWAAPANAGPEITGYAVEYREGTSGSWADAGHGGTDPTLALTGLKAGTAYQVRVQATNAEGTSPWSPAATGTTLSNTGPVFADGTDAFSVAENETAVGAVTATDADASDMITGYEITGGADRELFSIVEGTGVLAFKTAPDFEAPADADTDNAYLVEVTATSGASARELTAVQAVTVTVTDEAEAPEAPALPTISSVTASGFTVTWAAPANAGPAITGYAVEYREGTSGSWADAGHGGTDPTLALTGLKAGTAYQVRVQATNAEGTSPWSPAATGTTLSNAGPAFADGTDAFSVAENETAVGAVTATDADAGDVITGYEITGGADRELFSIVERTGVLAFKTAPDFEAPADADTDNAYLVEVTATSGASARELTAVQAVTVTVTDAAEAPEAPALPTISSVTASGVTVTWAEPANAGPAITGYAVEYREGTSGSWADAGHGGTDPTLALTGLKAGTAYQVRVQATNAEGTSPWSPAATGTTLSNAGPVFADGTDAFSVAENETAVGAVTATDADASDMITGYADHGRGGPELFSIVERAGVLAFKTAPDFEAPADADTDNAYLVEGDGDERGERAGADGGAGGDGDGDGRGRGAGGAGASDDFERDGERVHGDVGSAGERGPGDPRLHRTLP